MKTQVLIFKWSREVLRGISPTCVANRLAEHYSTNKFSREEFIRIARMATALIITVHDGQLENYLEAIKDLDSDTLKVVLVDVGSFDDEILKVYDFVRVIRMTPVCVYPVDEEWDCEKFLSEITAN